MYGMNALLDLLVDRLNTIKSIALKALVYRRTREEMRKSLDEICILADEARKILGYTFDQKEDLKQGKSKKVYN